MMLQFELFGASHILVIISTFLIGVLLGTIARKNKSLKKPFKVFLIVCWVLLFIWSIAVKYHSGWLSFQNDLPMHLCDWAAISIIIAFITDSQIAYELSYFWGLGGTLQAILTPDITSEFPDISFFLFFTSHSLVIISILFFTIGLEKRPYVSSIKKVFIASQIYLAAAVVVNLIFNANYGYLMRKPENPSLLDYFGEWPYYILTLEAAALLSFLVYYAPFFLLDKYKKN